MLNEIEARNLSYIKFKVIIIRMLKEFSENYRGLSGSYTFMIKDTETMSKNKEEMKNIISEKKNTLEEIKTRLDEDFN